MDTRTVAVGVLAVVVAGGGGFFLGRSSPAPTAPPVVAKDPGPIVARWSGGQLTADQLTERVLAQKAASGLKQLDAANGRTFADAAVRSALIAAEARRLGLERDPKVAGETIDALSKRLIELQFEDASKRPTISDAELKAFYDAHKSDFSRPERIRFSQLAVPKRADADTLRKELLATPPAQAEAAFAAKGGSDLGLLSRAELEQKIGALATEKAWLMVKLGEVSEVFNSEASFRLLRLTGREGGVEIPLEQARAQIESRLWYERRDAELTKFIDALTAKLGLAVDEAELKKVLAEVR